MKDHVIAQFVNELRDTANKHAGCQNMREALAKVVKKYIAPYKELHNIDRYHIESNDNLLYPWKIIQSDDGEYCLVEDLEEIIKEES